MYLNAQKNIQKFAQVIEMYRQLDDYYIETERNSDHQEDIRSKINDIRSRQEQLLHTFDLEDLKTLYAVASIGRHERGERHYYLNNTFEIIELEITENEEELLQKHAKFIVFLNKEELIDYFTSRVSLSQDIYEGMKILKLM